MPIFKAKVKGFFEKMSIFGIKETTVKREKIYNALKLILKIMTDIILGEGHFKYKQKRSL